MDKITRELVQRLINAQFPKWKEWEIEPVAQSGHDNRTFHLGEKMTVRLPSGPEYVAQIEKEARWLPFLQKRLSLPISCPVAMGMPSDEYPFPWSINRYIEGQTVTSGAVCDMAGFATELAAFLGELQSIGTEGAPAAGEHNFYRGASPAVYDKQVKAALRQPDAGWPVPKIEAIWKKAVASNWQHAPVWLHGDIAPGNLLMKDGHLCGVIDFGIMGVGDPACDYAMAWTFFDSHSRTCFLRGLDAGTIDRARGWALWKALITYHDADKAVADNARFTLENLLEEYDAGDSGGGERKHMNTPELQTQRLLLRRFTENDIEALYRIYSDEEVNRFLPWFPLKSREEARAFFEERYASKYAQPQAYAYAICLKKDGYPIGYIKVDMEEHHDLGYGLRKEFWHQGIVTEAAKAVIAQVKQDGLPYITATHDVNNPHSGGVMKKVGMKYQYSYEELWQPKNILVTFRMYQLNLDGRADRVYRKYWDSSAVHFVEPGV